MNKKASLKVVGEEIDVKTANKIIKLMEKYIELEGKFKEEREEINNRVKAAKADLKEKVESPHGTQPAEIENKLTSVEIAWQDWEEVQLERTELNKNARNDLSDVRKKIKEAIEHSKQGDLFDE